MDVRTASNNYPRQNAWIFHAGDTWNATSKLTLNSACAGTTTRLPARSTTASRSSTQRVNPGAGGRLGSLAFAGTSWGAASYGARYPEKNWYGGFAPRLGLTYALNTKTLVRAGWGIFYDRAYYPGWGAGMAQDGFNSNVSSTAASAASSRPSTSRTASPRTTPRRRSSARTTATAEPTTAPSTANERPRSQQWNLTVDREISPGLHRGPRLRGQPRHPRAVEQRPVERPQPEVPLARQPAQRRVPAGETSLNGVPMPYDGWVEQMQSCAPSVAQALLPYPQYCDNLRASTRTRASPPTTRSRPSSRSGSRRHVLPRLLHARQDVHERHRQRPERPRPPGAGRAASSRPTSRAATGRSPRRRDARPLGGARLGPPGRQGQEVRGHRAASRTRSSAAGSSRRSSATRRASRSTSGRATATSRASSGSAASPRRAATSSPRAGNFDRGQAALQPERVRVGGRLQLLLRERPADQRLPQVRLQEPGPVAHQEHEALKDVNLQLRIEAFNVWNWHNWNAREHRGGGKAFNTDIASPDFGMWNGSVTAPRVIQLAARLEF